MVQLRRCLTGPHVLNRSMPCNERFFARFRSEGHSVAQCRESLADEFNHLFNMLPFRDARWRQCDEIAGHADQKAALLTIDDYVTRARA